MASLTIRNLDEEAIRRLRIRAAHKNCSMEEEARNILAAAVANEGESPQEFVDGIRALFEPLGGMEPSIPARDPAMREPPTFQ